jgi:hypothetical protein
MQRDLVVVILYGSIYSQYKNVLTALFAYTPPYTHRQRHINEDKIVPSTDNFIIFAKITFLQFYTVTDTTVPNNDNEISLYFKPMRLIFMNYSV